jgi:transcriptional regulator with XRE-family HTH domain
MMTTTPRSWAVLGRAIRDDRERKGLTREQVAELVRRRGGSVTAAQHRQPRGRHRPQAGAKPPSLEPVVAALGWGPGWVDRILAGEDPPPSSTRVEFVGESGLPPQQAA